MQSKGGKGGGKQRVLRSADADPILPILSILPFALGRATTPSDSQSPRTGNGEQQPANSQDTAVAPAPFAAPPQRQGKALPLVVVGGGLGGAAAGKVLIEGLGWVSRKAVMKLGPMLGICKTSATPFQLLVTVPNSSHRRAV